MLSVSCFAAVLLVAPAASANAFEKVTPGGSQVRVEVVAAGAGLETTLLAVFDRVVESERMVATAVAALNAASGTERTLAVDPAVAALLVRAQNFCFWSLGATSPLGGNLRDHWRAAAGSAASPPPGAVASAACDHLKVDAARGTVTVAAGSRVDLTPFARGFAVDRAVDLLRERGVAAGWVAIDRVRRAFGSAPGANAKRPGWPVELPQFEGFEEPLGVVTLADRSLAIAWRRDERGGEPLVFDHRTGLPEDGVWAALAVTELALDAEALAATALAIGGREGRYRIASLRPEPSILWLLGRGTGRPLLEELRWSALMQKRH